MDDLIGQVKSAEAQGQTDMTLVDPKFDSDNNWPYMEIVGNRITTTLYRHKVVDKEKMRSLESVRRDKGRISWE
ncbi:MAG: hypothetical protein IKW81_01455 [Pseudobutyrivibrio sp.]|nr:hypothetical protein [Pseudobutyrivibrio sp.]